LIPSGLAFGRDNDAMTDDPADLVREGQEAIAGSNWETAARAFQAALERDVEQPDALFGLGVSLWWLGEMETSLHAWERAYVAYRRRADPANAVLAAVYLSLAFEMSLGNSAASRGWVARAGRLVDDHGLDPMVGWVLLCRAHLANDTGRPQAAERWAREAADRASTQADVNLELCALSELGAALVEQGRVEEGATMLDEAMAAALAGEGLDLDSVVLISCRTITACSRGGDLRRATQWVRAADDFYRRHGSPHLYTTCRTHYGGILFATGAWEQAEQELAAAIRIGRTAEPLLHAEALASLAELRLAQGRIDEASAILAQHDGAPVTTRVRAMVHLARGEPVAAAALLRRRLRSVDHRTLEGSSLLELLAEAEIELGQPARAASHGRRLHQSVGGGAAPDAEAGEAVADARSGIVVARAERMLGRAHLALGRETKAVYRFERALDGFARCGMPLEAARSRLLLARAAASTEPETAIAEARTSFTVFETIGAARDRDEAAALLRTLGARVARAGRRRIADLTARETEVLALLGEGLSNREIGDRLFITRKTVEHHVANVLAKTGLSRRGEAAAYAVRTIERDPTEQ
jgi:ATP/maltotriose-dependent transcriptional regulator MalT